MGILNVSPDSFYDGGKYINEDTWIKQTEKMLTEGAVIIDIGAFSSRPGAKAITFDQEKKVLIPAVKVLTKRYSDVIFSVDTYRSEIAKLCYENGAGIINDISGGNFDSKMFETMAQLGIPYVLMHMHGSPEDMQRIPISENITQTVKSFFETKVKELNDLGAKQIILDPGYGFGKSLECNFQLLKEQKNLKFNNLPLLAGLSRKSMINKILNTKPEEALNGTSIVNLLALQNGANLLRVHDVKEATQTIKLFQYFDKVKNSQ